MLNAEKHIQTLKYFFVIMTFMCVDIPTYLTFNPSYSISVVVKYFLYAPNFVDNL